MSVAPEGRAAPAAAATARPARRASTADLEAALAGLFERHAGPVEIIARKPLSYRSTFPIERLVVRSAGGGEGRLVFKDLSRSGPADPSWRLKAPFLHDPLREITCYREVLSQAGLSTPSYLGATVSPHRGRYWLFLDEVEGDPLWQHGATRVWCRTAKWLARLHARFEGRADTLPSRLIVHDEGYWQRWLVRARRHLLRREAPRCTVDEIGRLIERSERAVAWLVEQPVTLMHGDFYPSNVLVEGRGHEALIRPVDWEMAGIGPGILDLAALTSGAWNAARREAVVAAYHEALPRRIRRRQEDLRTALRRCRLLLAMQWLGWAARWNPPPEHAHDWLATAIDLAGSHP